VLVVSYHLSVIGDQMLLIGEAPSVDF